VIEKLKQRAVDYSRRSGSAKQRIDLRIWEKLKKISERAGRVQDKESLYTMQKLRALGYM
jgi:hypothetical protein